MCMTAQKPNEKVTYKTSHHQKHVKQAIINTNLSETKAETVVTPDTCAYSVLLCYFLSLKIVFFLCHLA